MAEPNVSISDHGADIGPSSHSRKVRTFARGLGFDAVGFARADQSLDRDIAQYDAFVAAGLHGEMAWLARNRDARTRVDGSEILPGAKSVVCLARRYQRPPDVEEHDSETARTIARYARGRDYHRFLRRRVQRLAAFLRSFGTVDRPVRARPLCDEEPILERAWAARAGLGFVGKNGMLIVPGAGSFVLLGEVVTTLDLDEGLPMAQRCGVCTRCLDGCPTGAFPAAFVLDPRRCIAYLTIEVQGGAPDELRRATGTHLFGCDDCQTVCPFNAGEGARAPLWGDDGDPFAPLAQWSTVSLEDILALDEPGWQHLSRGTPLRRAGRNGLARNAAIVLGNRGDARAMAALRLAADSHDSDVVREAAAWAVHRIAERTADPASP